VSASVPTLGRPFVVAGASPGTAAQPEAAVPPARAEGVQLIGAVAGSGYRRPPSLVRRADGQTIQLTPILYHLLAAADGERDHAALADTLGGRIDRLVTAEDVRYLVEAKLRPLGLLREPDGTEPATHRSNPLLALRLRLAVANPHATRRIAAPFAALFQPWIVVGVVAAFAGLTWWLLWEQGLASAAHQALYEPETLLLVFALTLLSAGFHELGHAAACRYGGASPGRMGVGLYLVWPAFFTDVTDSYRLGRGGRLRVDLGGLYFNAVFSLAVLAAWAAFRLDALLLVVAAQLLQMVRQLVPVVRFDGYHILADLTGVPDLFLHIGPTLRGLLPWRRGRADRAALKPWARAVVTAWVLLVVPILGAVLVGLVLAFPRLAATAWDSLGLQWRDLGARWSDGDAAGAAVAVLSMLLISLPVLGAAYLLTRMARRTVRRVWRVTSGRPAWRAGAVLVAAAVAAGIGWAWWPDGQYRPIETGERWTAPQLRLAAAPVEAAPRTRVAPPTPAAPTPPPAATPAAAPAPTPAPRAAPEKKGRWIVALLPLTDEGVPALAPGGAPVDGGYPPPELPSPPVAEPGVVSVSPTADPVPLVETPSAPQEGTDWPFPFRPPDAPEEGDNQVVAVNTTDGSTQYKVAVALVWVTDGGPVEQRNEAWALASCTNCTTVAVAFQVVLVVGYAQVVTPINAAVAVNYACDACHTAAVALQLVATLNREPSAATMTTLNELWDDLEERSEDFDQRPLSEVLEELTTTQAAVLEVLAGDEGTEVDAAVDEETTGADTTTATTTTTGATTDEPVETTTAGEPEAPPAATTTTAAEPCVEEPPADEATETLTESTACDAAPTTTGAPTTEEPSAEEPPPEEPTSTTTAPDDPTG
jgi:putative peptide zinc metalloprotease protein